ncbi:hypothetical protein [uncultured Maribacter sp.]|uniref:hypothetical protein n=1 Tax=uncultured Maribacter sp. TaxID=431308 RepID=UPI002617CA88|nr:hypothetical protein [uncultured Maribacter sp.]
MIFKLNIFLFSIFSLFTAFTLDVSKSTEEYKNSLKRFPTMVESLQHGEQFTIQITSIGCFHGERQIITVLNKDDVLIAHFKDKRKVLSPSDIDKFISFELQLRNIEFGGCTTIDTYVLSNDFESLKFSDSTCSWSGYKRLLALFK